MFTGLVTDQLSVGDTTVPLPHTIDSAFHHEPSSMTSSAPAVRLSQSVVVALQQQFAQCARLLPSHASTSPLASPPPRFLSSLTQLFLNILTFSTEYASATSSSPAPHPSFFTLLTHVLPALPAFLADCLAQPSVYQSPALPLLLQCVRLLPSTATDVKAGVVGQGMGVGEGKVVWLSAGEVERFLSSMLSALLTSPTGVSYADVRTALSPLSVSSLEELSMVVEGLLVRAGGDSLLPSVVFVLHERLRSSLPYPLSHAALSATRPPSMAAAAELVKAASLVESADARYVLLCRHKPCLDWALFALALPSVVLPEALSDADSALLLALLSAFFAGPTADDSPARLRVREALSLLLSMADAAVSLPTLLSSVASSTLFPTSTDGPSGTAALTLVVLVALIGRYAPVQADVSGYLTSLQSLHQMPLPTLLYHILSTISLFLHTSSLTPFPTQPPLLHACCESFAHALTCRTSVPAPPPHVSIHHAHPRAHQGRVGRAEASVLSRIKRYELYRRLCPLVPALQSVLERFVAPSHIEAHHLSELLDYHRTRSRHPVLRPRPTLPLQLCANVADAAADVTDAARRDGVVRAQVDVHVEREAVQRVPAAAPHAYGAQLAAAPPHARVGRVRRHRRGL